MSNDTKFLFNITFRAVNIIISLIRKHPLGKTFEFIITLIMYGE